MSSELWLKLKTRQLIERCGGLAEASRYCREEVRPYSVQQLSRCQTTGLPDWLPLDILHGLEAYLGEPVISRALVDARPAARDVGLLREELCDVTEAAARLQMRGREMLADDNDIDLAEAAELTRLIEANVEQLRDVAAVVGAAVQKRGGR